MHSLTGWFIRNPVAANLLMAFIIFIGVMTTINIRVEGFPRIPPENITIETYYDDATASQVDELVTQKIEKALEGLSGVRSISSSSENGYSSVTVRRAGGQDLQKLLDKVRLRVDRVYDLPDSIKRPVIDTDDESFAALYINLFGKADQQILQTLAERFKQDLLAEPEVSKLSLFGLHSREMRIEIKPELLRQYNLVVADVMDQIANSSLSFKGGSLKTAGGDILLKTDHKAKFYNQFSAIPVIERADGTSILLGEIATIKDSFADGDYIFRYNGDATIGMEVLVGQKENLINISAVAHRVVEQFKAQLPPCVDLEIWADSSGYISERLQMLRSNGVQGLLLVLLVLSLFLNVRLAFWVAMGIPVAVMGALAVAGSKWVDYSLNDITSFGLIIVLGILVDDAVVVGESVFEERQLTPDPIIGTEKGVAKVAVATVFGVLTTVAAFYPMMLIDNPLGKVLAGFSGIVIFALLFSLLESKLILPAHLAQLNIGRPARRWPARFWHAVQRFCRASLFAVRDRFYAPLLGIALRHRYTTLLLFIAGGVLGIGLIWTGQVRTVFFPEVPGQMISVNMTMDARAPFHLTRDNIEQVYRQGVAVSEEMQKEAGLAKPPIKAIFVMIPDAGSAQIYAELSPVSQRPGVEVTEVVRRWRQRSGRLEGANQFRISGVEEMGGGFAVNLYARDSHLLKLASDEVKDYLARYDGVSGIRDSLTSGQPQLELKVRPQARNLGFDTRTLAAQIGYAFGGGEVHKVRRDGEEVKVIVVNKRSARDSIADLMQAQLRSKDGSWYPLSMIAEVEQGYVSSSVNRRNGKRVNSVAANIDRSLVAPEEINQALFTQLVPELKQKYPGVEIKAGGEFEEMGEIKGGLKQALLIAAVLIYVLMAVPLKSYWQPVMILAIVPFGFVGATIGHLIMGLPLSLLSFFGMLALTGVVINDSLVLVTRYNQLREEGSDVRTAIQNAGVSRFQAIFLTTATTVIGLTPLLLETSEQAQYLIPAAASLAFGELFSTALMLLLVPVLLALTDDVKRLWHWIGF